MDVDGVGRARAAINFPCFLQYLVIFPQTDLSVGVLAVLVKGP